MSETEKKYDDESSLAWNYRWRMYKCANPEGEEEEDTGVTSVNPIYFVPESRERERVEVETEERGLRKKLGVRGREVETRKAFARREG